MCPVDDTLSRARRHPPSTGTAAVCNPRFRRTHSVHCLKFLYLFSLVVGVGHTLSSCQALLDVCSEGPDWRSTAARPFYRQRKDRGYLETLRRLSSLTRHLSVPFVSNLHTAPDRRASGRDTPVWRPRHRHRQPHPRRRSRRTPRPRQMQEGHVAREQQTRSGAGTGR